MQGESKTPARYPYWVLALIVSVFFVQFARMAGDAIFSNPQSIVEDDSRHFVVWLNGGFEDSYIAEYFRALTPFSYELMFAPAKWLGISATSWHRFAVIPFCVIFSLLAGERFLRGSVSNPYERLFIAAVLTSVFRVWLGLPRSFGLAIVLLSLSLFMENRRWSFVALIAAAANLYPIAALVTLGSTGVYVVLKWVQNRRLNVAMALTMVIAAAAAGIGFYLFIGDVEALGKTFTREEARSVVIFQPGGRTSYFRDSLFNEITCGGRAGFLPYFCGLGVWPAMLATVAALAAGALVLWRRRADVTVFAAVLIAGLVLFALAHLVAFKAHLPARYAGLTLGLLIVLGGALAFSEVVRTVCDRIPRVKDLFVWVMLPASLAVAFLAPWIAPVDWRSDPTPSLTERLRSMPSDTLVAGLPSIIDNIPAFAGRPVIASPELTVPYKRAYYEKASANADDMLKLLFTQPDEGWADALERSGIDVFINGPRPRRDLLYWATAFETAGAMWMRRKTDLPEIVFERHPDATATCTIASEKRVSLIDAHCLADKLRAR